MTTNPLPWAVLVCALASSAASQPADRETPAPAGNESVNAMINASEEHARLFDLAGSVIGAALNGGQVCTDYLVAQGFGIEDVGNATAPTLFVAATENRMDNVAWLVEHGADVNATDRQGGQLLTHALLCHDQALVDYLLAAGATPDSKTREVAARVGLSVGD